MSRIFSALFAGLALATSLPLFAQSSAAPGQAKADFEVWRAGTGHDAAVDAFKRYLRDAHADDIVPTYQLLRTSSSWATCKSTPFVVAPTAYWPAIVRTLQLIRDVVKPALGEVEAVSGYRDPLLNTCSHGAPASAHARFYALDLVPKTTIAREDMIRRLCLQHAQAGARWNWGLGFYSGLRFHVDTKGYRRWGADGRGATSPCAGYDRR